MPEKPQRLHNKCPRTARDYHTQKCPDTTRSYNKNARKPPETKKQIPENRQRLQKEIPENRMARTPQESPRAMRTNQQVTFSDLLQNATP